MSERLAPHRRTIWSGLLLAHGFDSRGGEEQSQQIVRICVVINIIKTSFNYQIINYFLFILFFYFSDIQNLRFQYLTPKDATHNAERSI